MLKDYAQGKVLPSLTDEALREERFYKGETAKLLLQVPAEQRQNVEREMMTRRTQSGLVGKIRPYNDVRREILAENGWLHTQTGSGE
jgi:hypothetical protein